MKVPVHHLVNTIEQEKLEAGRLQETYEVSVDLGDDVTVPDVFSTPFRPDLIRRAVHASRANRRQPYGHNAHVGKRKPQAGMKHSTEWWGKGRGVARIQRISGMRRGAENPHTRGGRRAHGPKVITDRSLAINRKERRLARASALAATADLNQVRSRGHRFDTDIEALPLVLGDYIEQRDEGEEQFDIEAFTTEQATRKLIAAFEALGLGDDLERARQGRSTRAGKGKLRGRRHRTPRSILVVVAQRDGLARAASNIPGVDVAVAKDLSTEDLAPGGDPGRLTVWTQAAIATIGEVA